MARDPDQSSAFVFDLVHDDTAGSGAQSEVPDTGEKQDADDPGNPHDGNEPGEPLVPDPARRWRVTGPVAGMLAIALGTGIAFDGARDNARIEQLRGLQGGLADVSVPLTETWAWHGAVGAGDHWYGPGDEVAVLGDVLAFESDGELVALNPATGKEAWAVPLGDEPECGPMGSSAYGETPTAASSVLVCVQGADADREVVTVGPDGAVSAPRALDPSDTRRFGPPRPGPDGTVLRATRVGPASMVDLGDASCSALSECGGTIEAGRDVELRAEDAVTGRQRWYMTIGFQPADAYNCGERSWEGPGGYTLNFDGSLHPDAFSARITAGLVRLDGCGVAAVVAPGGALLGTEFEPDMSKVESLGGGRYAALDYASARTILYDDEGRAVGELPGHVTGPEVTDGAGAPTLLASEASSLRAYEADGTPRWNVPAQPAEQPFLAQAAGTVVIAAATGSVSVRGLDLATGDERWRWDGSADLDGVLRTFTDGRAVLLVLTRRESDHPQLVSLDATTGEELWVRNDVVAADDPDAQEPATLVAVDGNLLEVGPAGVRGLG